MDKGKDAVKLYTMPQLRRPRLVASWSGMGAVAILTVNYLRQALGAQNLGEIDPHRFFSPSQVAIKDRLLQSPEFPEDKFYFCKTGAAHDLIFFVGTEQPSRGYDMALLILETVKGFGVEQIYTAAAFPTLIHHSQEPGVWGTATHRKLVTEMEAYGVHIMDHGTIGGLNGLLLAVAKERGLQGLCLLGEIPLYATQTINPLASRAVLTVLTRMLDVEIDLAKLTLWAEDLAPQMDKLYDLLPPHVKEAVERSEGAPPSPARSAAEAKPDLVADDEFFDQIERFLDQHWRRTGGEEDKDGNQLA
jgi:proteasome assembly chaperone (PAC2) family protein